MARFERRVDFDAFGAEASPAFKRILDVHGRDIVGSANLVTVEDHLSDDAYGVWEQAAGQYARPPNDRRGAFVANGLKQFSPRWSLNAPGAEGDTVDDFAATIG